MAVPAALLVLAGGLAALFTARQVERPLRTLSHLVSKAQGEVTQLSEQLLALQEEERQRIARELHDSTAQSLVVANLGLARLEREVEQGPAARKLVAQIEVLLDRALQELRVFTYLLHPPNLAEDGLKATLEEFIDGFAGRTGCGRGSGFPAGSTTPRRRSSAPFFGWCRRRWPTFIAMPGPQRFRSMRNWQAGKSSCESVTTAGASVNLRATSRSAGPGWASASQACAPGCGSSTAT
jgi:hypothetical protein